MKTIKYAVKSSVLAFTFLLSGTAQGDKLNNNIVRKTVKLTPEIRKIKAIETIHRFDPAIIQAYINKSLVMDENALSSGPYVVSAVDQGRILFGQNDQFYARGFAGLRSQKYQIFRTGRQFVDPITKERLGTEMRHIGDGQLLNSSDVNSDVSKLVLIRANSEVLIKDRLRAVRGSEAVTLFSPKAPRNININGLILESDNLYAEIGPFSVVVINLGGRDQVESGDVFRIVRQSVEKYDPITKEKYQLPHKPIGQLMVFRTFEKVSYAIIINALGAVQSLDQVISPEAGL